MGGKYEIIGCCYPCDECADLHEFTDSFWKAVKLYLKARKMFYCAFIVRNDKNKDMVYDLDKNKLVRRK